MPANRPSRPDTIPSSSTRRGSIALRYRSRFCCSAYIGRNGGRSRYATTRLAPTTAASSRPNRTNSSKRVHNTVPKTLRKPTSPYQSQSMYSDINEPSRDNATIRTAMKVSTRRVRREIAGTGRDGRMATSRHSWQTVTRTVLRTNRKLTAPPAGSRDAGHLFGVPPCAHVELRRGRAPARRAARRRAGARARARRAGTRRAGTRPPQRRSPAGGPAGRRAADRSAGRGGAARRCGRLGPAPADLRPRLHRRVGTGRAGVRPYGRPAGRRGARRRAHPDRAGPAAGRPAGRRAGADNVAGGGPWLLPGARGGPAAAGGRGGDADRVGRAGVRGEPPG